MRPTTITTLFLLVVTLAASPASARRLDGTVKLGGVIVDEEGDRSAVQETYNVYQGFSVTEIRLNGVSDTRDYFLLNLREINLGSRQGDFVYRGPGAFKLTAGYAQHRQVFSPERGVNSERKDWTVGAQFAPVKWLGLSGNFSQLARNGDRLSYPAGTASVLGTGYDNSLKAADLTADVHRGRVGGGASYRVSSYTDDLNREADRTGQVVSARLYAPSPFYGKWTHLLRGAYGVRRLTHSSDLDYTLMNLQYTGAIQPIDAFQVKYNFDANRVDDQSTRLKTDRFQNNVDATYFYRYGQLSGGYAYETNDDDRALTSYQSWRLGTAFRYQKYVSAKLDYASRVKKDQEELTLLKDVEASQIRAKLQLQPLAALVLGGGYSKRQRELPDIGVQVDGEVASTFGRWTCSGWGALSADYSFSSDDYDDLAGAFHTQSHILTARAEFDRVKNLRLAGGATYLDIRKDLDIEKSIVFVEGIYTLRDNYHLEVKYNVYNYDDYLLLDRYYTANVVRINLAYDLHLK
jgi:hypothetical protein